MGYKILCPKDHTDHRKIVESHCINYCNQCGKYYTDSQMRMVFDKKVEL